MHLYSLAVANRNGLEVECANDDIYAGGLAYSGDSDGPGYSGDSCTPVAPAGSACDTDTPNVLAIKTAYEERFLGEGRPITYLRFVLGERTEFEAPDFDEEPLYPEEERERKQYLE
jgi:tRNA (guanine-N7-)-methyltransferase